MCCELGRKRLENAAQLEQLDGAVGIERRDVRAPRRGLTSTSPVFSRARIASRTGLRDTPSCSARRSSSNRSPGSSCRFLIIARISSATISRNVR